MTGIKSAGGDFSTREREWRLENDNRRKIVMDL